MNLFYVPVHTGNEAQLNPEESRHLIKVLRYTTGKEVDLTDGKGHHYRSRISDPDPRACKLEIISSENVETPSPQLHIAVAPTKNIDRLEWFLEKAVEIGVSTVVPILCEHSERDVIKTDRLEKVMVSAMKQSLRFWLPTITPLTRFKDAIELFPAANRFIAQSDGSGLLNSKLVAGKDAFILIGPEGDFSLSEIQSAKQAGFAHVSLGASRLRTETAALVAVTAFSFCNLEK